MSLLFQRLRPTHKHKVQGENEMNNENEEKNMYWLFVRHSASNTQYTVLRWQIQVFSPLNYAFQKTKRERKAYTLIVTLAVDLVFILMRRAYLKKTKEKRRDATNQSKSEYIWFFRLYNDELDVI